MVVIIGIILSLVLVAGMDAVRRSEERATQSLISKLEAAVNDRWRPYFKPRPDYNTAHLNMANVRYSSTTRHRS